MRKVITPDDEQWRVGRQWVPLRVRLRKRSPEFPDLSFIDEPTGFFAVLAVIAVVIFLFLAVWPVIAIAIEVVLFVLILLGATGARFLLRRPWTVQAVSRRRGYMMWEVVGWRASGELIRKVAEALRDGRTLPAGGVQYGAPPSAIRF